MGCMEESLRGILCPSTFGGLKMLRARVCSVCIRSSSCIKPEVWWLYIVGVKSEEQKLDACGRGVEKQMSR